jgi:hypothetical protein
MSGAAFNSPDVSHSEVSTMSGRKSTRSPLQLPLPIEGQTIDFQLTKGHTAIIDAVDGDLLRYKWYFSDGSRGSYCVSRRDCTDKSRPNGRLVKIHRIILERIVGRPLSRNEFTDHVDGNPLNNCRSNLRLATNAENLRNTKKRSDNTSGYKGVHWDKEKQKWGVHIGINGKIKFIGRFTDIEEAREAYKQAAIKYHGEFARFE